MEERKEGGEGRLTQEAIDSSDGDDDGGCLCECVVTAINVLRSSRGVSLPPTRCQERMHADDGDMSTYRGGRDTIRKVSMHNIEAVQVALLGSSPNLRSTNLPAVWVGY